MVKAKGKVRKLNLKLYAIKNASQQIDRVQLVVVDLDKSKRYPLNFVCVLPTILPHTGKTVRANSPNFSEKKASAMAKKLLVDAWHSEDDPEIKTVINKRIKDIDSKQECPKLTVNIT